jgi:transcriptional regulator with XRE-family HTH domain
MQKQSQVAKVLGIKTATYLSWEKDQAKPRAHYYPALIGWLGYNPLPNAAKGQRLRRERLALGLTTRQMAIRLGIDQGTLISREHK